MDIKKEHFVSHVPMHSEGGGGTSRRMGSSMLGANTIFVSLPFNSLLMSTPSFSFPTLGSSSNLDGRWAVTLISKPKSSKHIQRRRSVNASHNSHQFTHFYFCRCTLPIKDDPALAAPPRPGPQTSIFHNTPVTQPLR